MMQQKHLAKTKLRDLEHFISKRCKLESRGEARALGSGNLQVGGVRLCRIGMIHIGTWTCAPLVSCDAQQFDGVMFLKYKYIKDLGI
jgi:hypothetical protein